MSKQIKIAIAHNFDSTLAPGNLQEHSFIQLPELTLFDQLILVYFGF